MINTEKCFKQKLYGSEGDIRSIIDLTLVCRNIPQNILISTVENFKKWLRLSPQENEAPFEHLING